MRASLRASALLLVLAACGDSTRPPAPATITLSVAPTPLDAIGASKQIVAVVKDEGGRVMDNATVTWSSSSANATVVPSAASSLTAVVTAAANGEAVVTARAGDATASASVVVAQEVAGITGEGSGQTGTVNTPLPDQLIVRIADRTGAPIAGREITFSIIGGGTLSPNTVTTAADGSARVTWTLGTSAALQQMVSASLGPFTTQFLATPRPAAASLVTKLAGDGQTWFTGTAVPVRPSVRVTDSYGNAIFGAEVTFVPTNGSVTGAVQATDVAGVATVGSWTLGTTDGAASVTATVPLAGATAIFNGTVQSTSPPVSVSATGTTMQAGIEGRPLTSLPAVRLTDPSGAAVAGRRVTFEITSGGGTTSNAIAFSDANGIATMSSWTLGSAAGPNTVSATVEGSAVLNNGPVFTAIGCTGGGSIAGFTINVCFMTPVTDPQRSAFLAAAARWGTVITGDVSDLPFNLANPSCGPAAPALHLTVDDLLIFARVEAIDGPGKVLGSAGWCYRRSGGLPVVGLMRFDEADVAGLVATGRFGAVIMHEMGHVLGIGGSLWSAMGFLQDPSSSQPGAPTLDTHFNGAHAIAGFDQIGGTTYTSGAKVPVENAAGPGSINAHWRESVLGNELMTPFLNMGSNPLTVLTVLSLRDLGYVVNPGAADQASMSLLHDDGPVRGEEIDLGQRMRDVPKHTIDRSGRIIRQQ